MAATSALAPKRNDGENSVHQGLVEWLGTLPRRGTNRWIILNDGPGEIADVLVAERLGVYFETTTSDGLTGWIVASP